MKRTLLAFLVFGALPTAFFAQSIFQHLELNVGYSVQHQDRRFGGAGFVSDRPDHEDTYYDHQFDVNINATLMKTKVFHILFGAGYSRFQTRYTRDFDADYFGDGFDIIHYSGRYNLHNLSFINTNKIILNSAKNKSLSFIMPIRADFTFDKYMVTHDWYEHFNKFLFEFNKIEIYMGLNGQLDRFTLSLLYRVFNYQKIDPVLFDEPDPGDSKYETINFYKLMLNAGYVF